MSQWTLGLELKIFDHIQVGYSIWGQFMRHSLYIPAYYTHLLRSRLRVIQCILHLLPPPLLDFNCLSEYAILSVKQPFLPWRCIRYHQRSRRRHLNLYHPSSADASRKLKHGTHHNLP